MTRSEVSLTLMTASVLLAGCGARRDLRPPEGQALPPAPYGATVAPTAAQLVAPTTEQRPLRSDELLRQSEERRDDPFSLPPAR